MSYFRKIDVKIWNDAKFRSLSSTGKLVFLMLVTHPNMTAIGAMRATPEGLAAELWSENDDAFEGFREGFLKGFHEVLSEGLAAHDSKACCVFIPNFVKYQAAESPNVIKAWAKQVEWVPECGLRTRAVAGVEAYTKGLSEGFHKAFLKAFPKDYGESVSSKQEAVSSKAILSIHGGKILPTEVHGDDFGCDPETGEMWGVGK